MRHLLPVVAALAGAVVVALTSGASAAPGPGGWDNLGSGATAATTALNGAVYALNADAPGLLYVGGAFTDAGGNATADYIASWNGTKWAALGAPTLNGGVFAIAYYAGKVYAGGVFTNAGGNPNADFLAVWDGTTWAPFCNGSAVAFGGTVDALQVIGSTLYVGGAFQNGAGIASADYLLACDLNTGASHSTVAADGDFPGGVYALTADTNGNLYAGGTFINLARIPAADHVAYLDPAGAWHAMGSGGGPGLGAVPDIVRSLAANGTDVYVGTDSVDVAGIPQADHVVKWNGSAWSALGSDTGGTGGWFPATASINSLTASGANVFAGGNFQNANGDPTADQIAAFDGTAWHPLGSDGAGNGPLNGNVTALHTFGTQLIAGGSFTNVGGNDLADFIAAHALPGAATPGTPPTGTVTGTVLLNGAPFTGGRVPIGSKVDVTRGSLLLTIDAQTATLSGGASIPASFVLLRGNDNGQAVVDFQLTGGSFKGCTRKLSGVSKVKPKTIRRLFVNATGHFRTRGRFAAASVRGTKWLTADRCDGTLTTVQEGTVSVRDLVKRKTVLVRAGKSYLAKKKG